MPEFTIHQVLRGRYDESNARRKVAVVKAPTAIKALQKFAGKRPAIVRIGQSYETHNEWVATIYMSDLKTKPTRDFVATPN